MVDMVGGSFTISNSGVWGSLFGTPIINMPQTAVLGIYGIQDRPMVVNGKIEIRPVSSSLCEVNMEMNHGLTLSRIDDVYCFDL